jgi:gluconolactonase
MFKSSIIGTAFVFILGMVYPLAVQSETWKVELLIKNLETAEGPVWDGEGKLCFTEIFANQIHEYTVETGEYRIIRRDSGGANGMAFDSRKRLLMCEMLGRRVTRRELDGTFVTLWQAENPGNGGPNDIAVSSNGNSYFTMPSHKSVYRIAEDGSVTGLIKDLPGINGVILSRDEKLLYVTEYKTRKVHAFPLNDTQGKVGTGSLFTQIHTEGTEHGADGMAIDGQDRLYVACLGGIWIFNRRGQQVGYIPLPDEKVTNCAFQGDDFNKLFITTQSGLFLALRQT